MTGDSAAQAWHSWQAHQQRVRRMVSKYIYMYIHPHVFDLGQKSPRGGLAWREAKMLFFFFFFLLLALGKYGIPLQIF